VTVWVYYTVDVRRTKHSTLLRRPWKCLTTYTIFDLREMLKENKRHLFSLDCKRACHKQFGFKCHEALPYLNPMHRAFVFYVFDVLYMYLINTYLM